MDDFNSSDQLEKASMLFSAGGLSVTQVRHAQEEFGLNELPSSKARGFYHFLWDILKEPMVYLLIGCAGIYFLLGDVQESLMLSGFLVLILGITIVQERKAEHALLALRDLSSPRALVIRNGIKQRISGNEVVSNDIIFINEGDRVPADSLLFSVQNIAADESMISGESLPVEKNIGSKLFAGSTIVRGQGIAKVLAIGINTELGKIGKSLTESKREVTKLERETNLLVKRLAIIAIIICAIVFFAYALYQKNWIEGVLAGLTLAMAIMPNELPAVLTIFLALGAWRMSLRRVLTRKLPAIENLGAATVLCVDKTGTLTLNQMSIQHIFADGKSIDLTKTLNESLPEEFHETLEFGILASKKDPFDPMELAFLTSGKKYLIGTEHLHHDWYIEKEYPLSSELLSISQAWKPDTEGGFIVGAKGAPEAIIDLCHLPDDQINSLNLQIKHMAGLGLRILGVAKAKRESAPLPNNQHDFNFTFVGFVGIADPVRPEVPKAIQECQKAGVRVIMMTGDHPTTASCIAKIIGLENPTAVITGREMNTISDEEMALQLKKISVFSRVMPDQKLRLVQLLKQNGEIVAMTGDGVNDAPALKNAHIGIAMGARGTDVARESAALVLLDDDFGSIVESIKMGRRVYANLQTAFAYLLAVHIPIAGMSVIPVIFNLPLVLLPAHIAFLHLIIEPTSSLAFEAEPSEKQLMTIPPRPKEESLFNKTLWKPSLLQGVSVLVALLAVYIVSLKRGQGELDARALVFSTLIFSNIMFIFVSGVQKQSIFRKVMAPKNIVVKWIVLGSIVLWALVIFVPGLRDIFRFSKLHLNDILLCFFVGIISVLWLDLLPNKLRIS